MKNKLFSTILLLSILLIGISCQTTSNVIFGTNKVKSFTSREDYFKNFTGKSIDKEKVVFLNSELFDQLSQEIMSKKLSFYYGIAGKNFYSGDQLSVKSCSGQFQTLYSKADENDSDLKKENLKSNTIIESLKLQSGKKTAIFIYSYKLGRLSNSRIFDIINELNQKSNFDYRIISLDNNDVKL